MSMGMGIEMETGLFTAPWWYYALVTACIVFALYCVAPDTKTKKLGKSKFTSKKTNKQINK